MSHWDFSRRPDAEHGATPAEPADTADEPDPLPDAPGEAPAVPAPRRADDPWRVDDPWATSATSTDGTPWTAAERQPGGGMPPGASGFAAPGRPFEMAHDDGGSDAWGASGSDSGDVRDGEDDAPYPVTWERDDFEAAAPEPGPTPEVAPSAMPWQPWPSAPYTGAPRAPGAANGGGWGRDVGSRAGAAFESSDGWEAGFAALGRPRPARAQVGWPAGRVPVGLDGGGVGDGDQTRPADRRGRHWLVLAGIIVAGAAVGVAAAQFADRPTVGAPARGSQPGSAPATPSATVPDRPAGAAAPAAAPPLTLTQAKAVLAAYTAVNNEANAQRSDALLATTETGSSYAIDAGSYLFDQGAAPFPAFGPAQATYYIPSGESATRPRWFVAQVANAFASNPAKVTSDEYLLFTQQAPGDPWLNAAEPFLLAGPSFPKIAVGADGLATAVSPSAADVIAPGQLPAVTAASLDGAETAGTAGQATVTPPGNLTDLSDLKVWQGELPDDTVTDTHAPATGAAGQEFALRTADGGALVFYADAAQLTITPPAGTALHLSITGFYSPAQALSRAGVTYLEQFAAYDPPAGGKAPTVVADYSGITGKD